MSKAILVLGKATSFYKTERARKFLGFQEQNPNSKKGPDMQDPIVSNWRSKSDLNARRDYSL